MEDNDGVPAAVASGAGGTHLKLQPPVLDLNVERYAAFKAWKEKWEDYALLSNLDRQDKKKQAALLRYTFSSDTRKIYNSLALADAQKEEPEQIIAELEKFAKGTINEILERHHFNNRRQQDGEKFDDFLTELKVLATNCNYCVNCYPGILRDRVVEGVSSDVVREKLIAERILDLDTAVEKCRSFEVAAEGVKTISGDRSSQGNVDRVDDDRRFNNRSRNNKNSEPKECKFCLKKHKWGRNECPAYGKTCNDCKKPNHFSGSSMCSSPASERSVDLGNGNVENNASSINASNGYMQVMFMGSVQATGEEEDVRQEITTGDDKTVEEDIPGEESFHQVTEEEIVTPRTEVIETDSDISVVRDEHDRVVALEEIKENIIIGWWSMEMCIIDEAHTENPHTEEVDHNDEITNINSVIDKSRQERRSDERFIKKLIQKIEKQCQEDALVNTLGEASVKDIDDDFYIRIKAGKGDVRLKLDTGADVTVIRPDCLHLFGLTKEDLKPTQKTLRAASGTELVCHGYFVRKLKYNNKSANMHGYVCENVQLNLLGKPELKKLELIKLNKDENVDACSTDDDNRPEILEFPRLFNSLGRISGEPIDIKLEMKDKQPYHLSCPRRVAIPHLKWLEEELNRMEGMGVIKEVTEPTDWCHPIVLVEKPGSDKIRLCLDLTRLNKCVKREYYQLPSVDETLAKIGKKGKVFSKLDANSGYWQMPLNERSQKLCTFITPFGRYCPTVGPFGLSSMPEIFSRKMDEIILGLPGVVKNMDDFLIFGETVDEHDENLNRVLKVMDEYGMTLNKTKCLFRQKKVDFLGFTVSDEGIVPKEQRLSAIREFKPPTNITELRRFMGLAQYVAKFTNRLAEVTEPLRGLMSSKNAWLWTPEHNAAFEATKDLLCSPQVLAMYDVNKTTKVRTDASKLHGVSIIVYQQTDQVCALFFERTACPSLAKRSKVGSEL